MKILPFWMTATLVTLSTVASAEDFVLEADEQLQWRKGNMHTHSLWSDGDDYPEMIAKWYQDHGYQFLVHTDHNILMTSKERWIDVEKNKGGRAAFDKLRAEFGEDWVEVRQHKERDQVRLKTFGEVFERMAVPQQFLLVQGEEVSDAYDRKPIHMCAMNLPEYHPPMKGSSVLEVMQNNVNFAMNMRERTGVKSIIHLNHPNFRYAITAEQLMKVVGERFFEVYNGHPSVNNSGDADHASTESMWDIINTWRLAKLDLPLMYGLGTDDGHDYHKDKPGIGSQPGRAWVMVLTDRLTPEHLVTALEAGRFYSSSGVTLNRIAVKDGTFSVEVAAEEGVTYDIAFVGTRKGFNQETQAASEDETKAQGLTRVYSDDVGQVLQTTKGHRASYRFAGDELYVRAVVTSSKSHPNPPQAGDRESAWVQPVNLMKTTAGQ